MSWLIDTERLTSCETVEALRSEIRSLVDSGVPIEAVLDRVRLDEWYRKRLSEPVA